MVTAVRIIRWFALAVVAFFLIALVTGVGTGVAVALLVIAVLAVVGTGVASVVTRRRR